MTAATIPAATTTTTRTAAEYAESHLDGALNISYLAVGLLAKSILPCKERPVIVYCSTGKRSMQAKSSLEYLGYEKVYYLGGIEFEK